ncbi:polyribonucleotide nucleotidyltransferase [Acrocarpospora macrocephala]|uniref:Polyribonucleotide nucleotidyltransferase n=1 Tax=Acrocarpospora macrocephala TaxID=150177 RepID=A0A5M3WZ43_9ACTN|nr:polyribonucleotide nucleotidyltransferase [Acrocarpospora macrocephala]GES11703.1 polyribonucleotide nucleotidyltransferase [Acrocarpospora macrocephala]
MEGVHSTEAVIDNGSFGTRTIRFETGRLARQAAGSAVVYLDDETMVLSATTASKNPKENLDFFPLTVDVEERMYAAGRIPGSFFRREGRPSEDAILTCRLIDRPLRPSFVKGLRNEIQVVATIMSLHPDHLYDVVAINAASLSTQLAGLPFSGPIGGVRVALITGQWVAFPTHTELEGATFDMVVAGRVLADGDVAIMMVEAESTRDTLKLVAEGAVAPTEETIAQGLEAAKPFIKVLCEAQAKVAQVAAKETAEYPIFLDYQEDALQAVENAVRSELAAALTIAAKQDRESEIDRVKALAGEKLLADFEGREKEISAAFRSLTKKLMRERVISEGIRIDGRGPKDIRQLNAEVHVVPRVHGSALFERGETQILGITTLNMLRMEQMIDTLNPERTKRYMHNYNFPPYSTGETGRVGSPKRREIGHGALAERALIPVLPTREEFPYAIRQVSEALGSNGSTSMGSVCASTMALLDAGVPLKEMVAGIAMGLIGEGDQFITLTDILGAEDAMGDMDFKVAGTKDVITALQLDTKLDGIPASVLAAALKQARGARLAILDVMQEAIDSPAEMNPTAPRIITIKVPVDKIGEVIGPKGKMINQIQDDTGAEITIEDDGTIYIGATDGPAAEAARSAINAIANPHMPEVGERYLGTVVKIAAFGAFVSLMPGKDGLLHVSQIRKLHGGKRIENVEDVMGVGEKIQVEIAEIDARGKLSLVPVEVVEKEAADRAARAEAGEPEPAPEPRESRDDRPREDRPRDDRPRRSRTRGGRDERNS